MTKKGSRKHINTKSKHSYKCKSNQIKLLYKDNGKRWNQIVNKKQKEDLKQTFSQQKHIGAKGLHMVHSRLRIPDFWCELYRQWATYNIWPNRFQPKESQTPSTCWNSLTVEDDAVTKNRYKNLNKP